MQFSLFWCGLGLCLPFAASAQAPAAHAASPVPALTYRSVFTDTPKGVEADALDWRTANAEVGRFTRGHIDILKWEAAQQQREAAKVLVPGSNGSGMEMKKP